MQDVKTGTLPGVLHIPLSHVLITDEHTPIFWLEGGII